MPGIIILADLDYNILGKVIVDRYGDISIQAESPMAEEILQNMIAESAKEQLFIRGARKEEHKGEDVELLTIERVGRTDQRYLNALADKLLDYDVRVIDVEIE